MTTQSLAIKENLHFQDTSLAIYDIHSTPWLQSSDLAAALGYKDEDGVRRIFDRNQDEFSAEMSQTVKLTVSGNYQKTVRLFSPRGCHLIAMLSHTKRAKEFRKWVLDVLERYNQPVQPELPTVYAKVKLESGTDGNPATTKQVGRVIGKVDKLEIDIEKLAWKCSAILTRIGEVCSVLERQLKEKITSNEAAYLHYANHIEFERLRHKVTEAELLVKRTDCKLAAEEARQQLGFIMPRSFACQDNATVIRAG
jgi:hypothetical protein